MNLSIEEQIHQAIREVQDFPKEGIGFKDISGILANAELANRIIKTFATKAPNNIDAVCAIESRGFLFGFPLALELNVPFYMIRKKGKLPPPTVAQKYKLEYGEAEIEMVEGQIKRGQNIVIHDDVLATGGTAMAAKALIERQGGKVVQFNFLMELEFLKGRELLKASSKEIVCLKFYK